MLNCKFNGAVIPAVLEIVSVEGVVVVELSHPVINKKTNTYKKSLIGIKILIFSKITKLNKGFVKIPNNRLVFVFF